MYCTSREMLLEPQIDRIFRIRVRFMTRLESYNTGAYANWISRRVSPLILCRTQATDSLQSSRQPSIGSPEPTKSKSEGLLKSAGSKGRTCRHACVKGTKMDQI